MSADSGALMRIASALERIAGKLESDEERKSYVGTSAVTTDGNTTVTYAKAPSTLTVHVCANEDIERLADETYKLMQRRMQEMGKR